MLSSLAAIAAAFTLQTDPQVIEAVCQVNESPAQYCQLAVAQEGDAIGVFFAFDGDILISYVGTQTTPNKISVVVLGINDAVGAVDSGHCQASRDLITCTATLGSDTLTVRARPTQ